MLSVQHLDLYASYKSKTDKVICWIQDASGKKCGTVRMMYELACQLAKRGITPPEELYWKFLDAIAQRTEIAKAYEVMGGGTASNRALADSHKHFIEMLQETLEVLFPQPPQWLATTTKRVTFEQASRETSQDPSKNSYASLQLHTDSGNSVNRSPTTSSSALPEEIGIEGTSSNQAHRKDAGRESEEVMDDPIRMNEYVLLRFVTDCDLICNSVRQTWQAVGAGHCSLMYGAILTTAAKSMVEPIRTLLPLCEIPDFKTMMNNTCLKYEPVIQTFLQQPNIENRRIITTERSRFLLGPGFLIPWAVNMRFSNHETTTTALLVAKARAIVPVGSIQTIKTIHDIKKIHHLQSWRSWAGINPVAHKASEDFPEGTYSKQQLEYFTQLLAALSHAHTTFEPITSGWPRKGVSKPRSMLCPLFKDFGKRSESLGDELLFSVGLVFMAESFESFLASDSSGKRNCRIELLKFAKEVQQEIKAVLKSWSAFDAADSMDVCELLPVMEQFEHRLEEYNSKRHFDLYSSSPWLCGSQMLEICHAATAFGSTLLNRPLAFPFILHIYNAMYISGVVQKVKVLEALCEMFVASVFIGVRPTKKFQSCLARRMRATLPDMTSRHLNLFGSLDTKRVSMKRRPDKEINFDKLSPMHDFWNCHYSADWKFFQKYSADKKPRAQSVHISEEDNIAEQNFREGPAPVLQRIDNMLRSELHGEFPGAKINWLSVYRSCSRMMDSMGKLCAAYGYNTPVLIYDDNGGTNQFAGGLVLTMLDPSFAEHRQFGGKLEVQKYLQDNKRIILDEFDGEKGEYENWMWKNM